MLSEQAEKRERLALDAINNDEGNAEVAPYALTPNAQPLKL